MTLESKIQAKIIKFLEKQQDCMVIKLTVTNKTGIPDLLVLTWEWRHFWIETKQEKWKLSEIQKYRIGVLEAKWDKVIIAYWFEDFIEQFMLITL